MAFRVEERFDSFSINQKKKSHLVFSYRPFDGSGNPSKVQVICGDGFPAAEHFNDTAGPGWSVCSMKLYMSTGGASAERQIDVERVTKWAVTKRPDKRIE